MKNSVTGSPPLSPRVSQMIPIQVYYVERIYEDGFGLSMEKWPGPGAAEKHDFVGVAAAFGNNTDNSFCFTSGNALC